FWGTYGALTAASRLFDRSGGSQIGGTLALAAIEACCWMLVTPPVFALAARVGGETRRRRAAAVVAIVVTGIVIAVALGWFGTVLRRTLTPFAGPPPRVARRASGPRGPGGPPIWFGMLNALVLYAGVVAAGIARAYSSRYHARREEAARREAGLHAQLAEARVEALRRQLDPH